MCRALEEGGGEHCRGCDKLSVDGGGWALDASMHAYICFRDNNPITLIGVSLWARVSGGIRRISSAIISCIVIDSWYILILTSSMAIYLFYRIRNWFFNLGSLLMQQREKQRYCINIIYNISYWAELVNLSIVSEEFPLQKLAASWSIRENINFNFNFKYGYF